MPSEHLTPEQQAAQQELDTVLQSDDYLKGDAWTQQAAAERALEARRTLLGGENKVLLQVGDPPDPGPPPIDPTSLPALPGDTWSPAKLRAMADAGKEFGIPEAEVREWLTHYATAMGKEPSDLDAAEEELREEWGARFDDNLRAAWLASRRFSLAVQDDLDRLGNDPTTLRRLAALGQPMQAAEAKIATIMADKKHAWHRGDPKALEEMTNLYKILNGTTPVVRI